MKKRTTSEFVELAKVVHGNEYDYSKVEYVNSLSKVCIICHKHGEFWQTPKAHLNGNKCFKCANIRNGQKHALSFDVFVEKARAKHGDKYDYSTVKYVNSYTNISIVCPKHGEFYQTPSNHIRKTGCPLCAKDEAKGRMFGVNDSHSKAGNISYRTWASMLDRCYNSEVIAKHPTYNGCSVSDEWKFYSNFAKWYEIHYINGWELDKDLLVKGNKIYSADTCCFLPREINAFLTSKRSSRGIYPIGVALSNDKKKFIATLGCLEKPHLGTFNTVEDAFNAYKKAKEDKAKDLANKWKNQLDPRAYEALYNYQVDITD